MNIRHDDTVARGNGSDQLMRNDGQVVTMQHSSTPKRGARACTACRKGKNRCEGEVSHAFTLSRAARFASGGPWSKAGRRLVPRVSSNLAMLLREVNHRIY